MSDVSSVTSGTTGAGGGNMIRLTGLASGLDVDSLVKKMMAGEQTKLDKAQQDQQTTQWKQEAYQNIIKNIKDLQSSFFDSGSADKNILSTASFSPFTVSGDGVDTSVATLTPLVGAKTGRYTVSVAKLAKGAGVTNSLKVLATGNKATLSTNLNDITGDTSLNVPIKMVLNIGDTNLNVTLDNRDGKATVGDLVSAINNQTTGVVKATYSELTGKLELNSGNTGESTSLAIRIGSTAALSKIIGFNVANNGTTTTADWRVSSTSTDTAIATATIQKGQNADVTITPPGGTPVEVTDKTSNRFSIDGMSYVLSSEGPDGSPVTTSVNVGADSDKVYNKIKDFIDKYNTIVDDIQTKLTDKKDRDYKPLTDAQKASMSTSQITAWETKAKVGIVRDDDNLESMLSDLRTAFTTSVSNAGLSLGRYSENNFGIDTSKDYTTPAHIDIVDPTALKTAIETKSDQIAKIFTNTSTRLDTKALDGSVRYDSSLDQYKEDGILTRIKKIFEKNVGFTNTTLNTATLTSYANKQYDFSTTGTGGKNTLPDQMYEQQLKIKDIKSEMSTKQEKYYQQFSKLEVIMNQLNSQQLQLSSMIGN